MPGDADLTEPAAPGRSLRLLAGGAAATVVVGFAVGFAIGGRGSSGTDDAVTAAGPTPSTVTPTTVGPATSAPSTTRLPASSSTSTSSTTTSTTVATTAPVTTTVVPFPTTAPTVATTVPPTVAPSRVVVVHGSDGRGRLVLPRNGSATLVITNEGGLAQQWLVTGTGFTTAGSSQGTLGPGQTTTVTIVAPRTELPSGEVTGIISVLGAVNPTVAFVIPPA